MADYEPGTVSRVSDDGDSGDGGKTRKRKRGRDARRRGDSGEPKGSQAAGGRDGPGGDDDGTGKDGKDRDQKGNLKDNMKKAAVAGHIATQGAKMAITARLMAMMKLLLQLAMQLAAAAAQAVTGFISSVVAWVAHAAATVAAALGISAAVATGGIAALAVVAVIAGAALVGGIRDNGVRDDLPPECEDDNSYMYGTTDATGNVLENAKKLYAFMKLYGLPDTNIAGILGNFEHESGIDPTGVETIFTEPYSNFEPGTRKYEAWQGSYEYISGYDEYDDPIWTVTWPANFMLSKTTSYGKFGLRTYVGDILSASRFRRYSDEYPGIHYLGIGLGQWTNGRNLALMDYADAHEGFEWYDLETQLMFMVDPSGGDMTSVNFLADWEEEATPEDAARTWCQKWEGIGYQAVRGESAKKWYATFAEWANDDGMADIMASAQSLLDSVSSAGSRGSDRSGVSKLRSCSEFVLADNTSAAAAILAYAWGPGETYAYNNGTACYQHINDSIFGDGLYMSCDRTVATAIHWSGTDVDYPRQSCAEQLRYLMTSPRWRKIEWDGDTANLQPGDVLIRSDRVTRGYDGVGHTLMWVGHEMVKARFGDEYNGIPTDYYCLVSGSINKNSPHVQGFTTSRTSPANDLPSYFCYRNIKKYDGGKGYERLSCAS